MLWWLMLFPRFYKWWDPWLNCLVSVVNNTIACYSRNNRRASNATWYQSINIASDVWIGKVLYFADQLMNCLSHVCNKWCLCNLETSFCPRLYGQSGFYGWKEAPSQEGVAQHGWRIPYQVKLCVQQKRRLIYYQIAPFAQKETNIRTKGSVCLLYPSQAVNITTNVMHCRATILCLMSRVRWKSLARFKRLTCQHNLFETIVSFSINLHLTLLHRFNQLRIGNNQSRIGNNQSRIGNTSLAR